MEHVRSFWPTLALLAAVGCTSSHSPETWVATSLPALDETGWPALPKTSPRNANYTIDVRLDPEARTLEGRLVLDWRNLSSRPATTFPFHLYWNAFRNNRQTFAREARRSFTGATPSEEHRRRRLGWVQVRSVKLEDGTDLTPGLRYIQPDDGNPDDRSLMEVRTPRPVAPGASVRFHIEWHSRIHYGDLDRAGFVHDYHFISQWFPKLAVRGRDGWTAHQFHARSEFFSDFGVYDVRIRLPRGFVVGATGRQEGEPEQHADGTVTHRYVQEDVHDFAWAASRRFVERRAVFAEPELPRVDLRLLLQPEHVHLAERYFDGARTGLRRYAAEAAPYPYRQLTLIDPTWNSGSGGMEYPTLVTGGANVFSLQGGGQGPEDVTLHEVGHQFWYGLVATNEFEEAWLDEGFTEYGEMKHGFDEWGPRPWSLRYFGLRNGPFVAAGWPVPAPGVWRDRTGTYLATLRRHGQTDVMMKNSWEYRTGRSFVANSYYKPALMLRTLEGLVGKPAMRRVLGTYARRYRFAHPTTADFVAIVHEVTGEDYGWFFEQTFRGSGLCDYSVWASNRPRPEAAGLFEDATGKLVEKLDPGKQDPPVYESEVVVMRLGELMLPVDVLVEFDDGTRRTERWPGKERWIRFAYEGPRQVRRAVADPEGKLALDVDPSNNAWIAESGPARRAAHKWSARYLFWLQNLLELHTLFS